MEDRGRVGGTEWQQRELQGHHRLGAEPRCVSTTPHLSHRTTHPSTLLVAVHTRLYDCVCVRRLCRAPLPERKLVPSGSAPMVPSLSAEVQSPPRSILPLPHWVSVPVGSSSSQQNFRLRRIQSLLPVQAEDAAPPRPPLPRLYDYEETPPVIPPLPREASVVRHTSVRGLKRQSERKRDRDSGLVINGDWKV